MESDAWRGNMTLSLEEHTVTSRALSASHDLGLVHHASLTA